MHDSLHRLYRTKLVLLATLLLAAGLGFLFLGQWIPHLPAWRWAANWPITDIGSAMFTTGLLGVAWQYLDSSDSEARDSERLKRVLAESAPAMRDAVIRGFAFEPEDLTRVATPEVLDQIITNGLAIRLGDAGFAQDVYEDVRQQAIGVPERLHDARVVVHLSAQRSEADASAERDAAFVATIRWEARLHPKYQLRRFSCVSDAVEYREVSHDTTANSAWYLSKQTGLDASDRDSFELLDFTVNGDVRKARRTSRPGSSQTYQVDLGVDAMRSTDRVTISYTYRTLIPVRGRLLQLRVDQPTRGLSVELDYTATEQQRMTVLDFIAGGDRTRVNRSPADVPSRVVSLEYDGWVFPRSGVAFVWPDEGADGAGGNQLRAA